ncbi:phosphopantetheine-binding protein [Escherichia coli]|nr:phosphopantetheine-binding protein [Escherichia coli]
MAHALLHEHHYYNDHTRPLTDLMNLLECARQAETYVVHKYEKQPLDTRFILTEWACNFTANFIPTTDLLNRYVSLKIVTSNTRRVKERLLSQSYNIDVYQDHLHIANVYMSVKYMTDNAYCIVRKEKIKSYSSKAIVDFDEATRIIPERVFRRGENNVVVNMPVFNENRIISKLAVNMDNTAYFDHAQDHYPAMVLMEAGKQNCQLWIYKFEVGIFPVLIEMKSKFFHYAELDKDVEIISVKVSDVSENTMIFNVHLRQGGVDIAEMQYSFKVIDQCRGENMDAVKDKVVEILVENFGLNEEKVKENNDLESLGVDSIITIEIQLDLERAFDIKIPDGDILPDFTAKDISDYIKNKG